MSAFVDLARAEPVMVLHHDTRRDRLINTLMKQTGKHKTA